MQQVELELEPIGSQHNLNVHKAQDTHWKNILKHFA